MRVLFVFGTRPEAIKLAPVIRKFQSEPNFKTEICITSQHTEMLNQVLDFFEIVPDYNLQVMEKEQTLNTLTCKVLQRFEDILLISKPDVVFVQGDTTSAFTSALVSFYYKILVAHVEAGLRTFNKFAPFPEEINRVLISHLADFHFCPTLKAKENLIKEGIKNDKIFVVGNTVIDALMETLKIIRNKNLERDYKEKFNFINFSKKLILVTAHRRENFGKPLEEICLALKELALSFKEELQIVFPVHLNPKVTKTVKEILGNLPNLYLLSPLSYPVLIWLMGKSYFILTDSGGIQEEAPILGKPILVMRNLTERPEVVSEGIAKVVGTKKENILKEAAELIINENKYKEMAKISYIYGCGQASEKISTIIKNNSRKEVSLNEDKF
ncbi:MAG: UDP-N-acetylglucosamine 2-epimerase (non-hydrolyzing) [Deltaproteobacteria bacterium]|nr:UDP-N-acetylglucosamine 2-epimerase (non-hydrolyzing) [Deltaproteobacteria bacterium]